MRPLISVIVQVYNAKPYLDRCVQSIIHPTYKNSEIILIDDGLNDGSKKSTCRVITFEGMKS